jgi:tetratricopeptide (TPR) repeat protein
VLAHIEQCLGNIQGAITAYNQAIRLDPTNTQIWLDLAKLYKDAQEYDNAAATLSKILDGEPTNLQARISRANLYQKLGAADKAIAEASEAIQLHPKKAEAYSARATLYNYGGNYDKAIADADFAIQLNPSEPDAYYAGGFAKLKLKDYAGAIHDLTEEIKLDPYHDSAWQCRGFALRKQGKYAEARADLLQASKLNPKSAELFNALAWLLATCPDAALRDAGKAKEYIDHALQLDSKQTDFWDTRAAVFAETGDFENAISWEERFLERKDLSEDQRRRATDRVALYRAGKPYHEAEIISSE